MIPAEVLMTNLGINFGQSREICEIIVAGINANNYKCPAGKFLKTNPAVLCEFCPAGFFGDVEGLKTCKPCLKNEISVGTGNKKCTLCGYLEYSAAGSTSCQQCDSSSDAECPLNAHRRGQNKNLISTAVGTAKLRSFDRGAVGDHELSGTEDLPLESAGKPFLVHSVVLVMSGDNDAIDALTVNSKKKIETLTDYSDRTDVFEMEEAGVESITLQADQAVTLLKVFVFGIPFQDAPAPAGHRNTGSRFEECPAGTYSLGGPGVSTCTPCKANQEQPVPGQTSCSNCQAGYYSDPGNARCTKCGLETPQCLSACEKFEEQDLTYGAYSWPATPPGDVAEIACVYNGDSMAFKRCDSSTKQFEATDFRNCKSKVAEQIEKIDEESKNIKGADDQREISEKIRDVTEINSDIMNSKDVKKTSDIIDNLIDFDDDDKKLDEDVRNNILKAVGGVHKSTKAKEIAKDDVASSMRNSVEKLSKKITKDAADDDEGAIYVKEQTMGVVVSKTRGDTSFTVSGDKSDYTHTDLENKDDKPVLFSVKVPANEKKSPVTAILYDTPKFYPDGETLETVRDITSVLAQQFTSPNRTKKSVSQVVSMVTEIKYADTTGSVNFVSGKKIEMTYSVKPEKPETHYKMSLNQNFECVFYDTSKETWVTGKESGCDTIVETASNGEKSVSCRCSHMTSFAVLMSFDSDYDPLEETVTSILLGISLGCLFFTIIAYLPAKEMLRTRSVRINLLLVTSLMFSIIVFYFMELVVTTNVKEDKVPTDKDTASLPCVIVAFLMNYFWLCQMAWMVCEALVMYRALVSAVMDSHIHRYMLKFNLACWGIPLVFPIAGICWGQTDFANPKTCFLKQKYGLVTFYGPVILCILFNIFIFIRIAWNIFRKQSMETSKKPVSDLERRKKQFKFAITVMTLLGVAWIFGFFLIIEGTNTIWLRWLFIIFNSTQGVFIFILYVVLNDNLKKVWRKLLNISDSDKPSHSSVPYSRSKGPGTKQTFANTKSMSEMDPMSTATTRSKLSNVTMTSTVTMVQPELDRSRSASPRSTLMTTSLVTPEPESMDYKMNDYGNKDVHIYGNVASVIGDNLNQKFSQMKVNSNFDQNSSKNTNLKHRRT